MTWISLVMNGGYDHLGKSEVNDEYNHSLEVPPDLISNKRQFFDNAKRLSMASQNESRR
jgi:hypothetical protein